ncbi:hypothetical protein [Saccharopolyspora sp. NPDC002376]
MTDGFSVDLEALDAAANGAQGLVDELASINGFGGMGETLASNGRGLQDGLMEAGPRVGGDSSGLGGALMVFGRSWEWGLRQLVEDGQAAADALSETTGEYRIRDAEAAKHIQRVIGDDGGP